jgi:hypothetical protein
VRHARNRIVVRLARLAEDVGGDDAALVLADVSERPDARDVADRPLATIIVAPIAASRLQLARLMFFRQRRLPNALGRSATRFALRARAGLIDLPRTA